MKVEIEDDSLEGDPVLAWYAPRIEPSVLRNLMRRTDWPGIRQFGSWMLLCVASGLAVIAASGTYWIVPAELVYGIALSFSYAASHECAHGTPFRTRWLNEAVFWLTSVVFMEEASYRRYAHADHHTHTWLNGLDPQKPYGIPLTYKAYIKETFSPAFYLEALGRLLRHASGRFTEEERGFLPERERGGVRFDSAVMLLLYTALLAWGVLGRSPWPFLLYFIPRYIGGCVVNIYINTQHMYMAEDVRDHRVTTRSIRCTVLERWLYWNMNWHIEHHLYPAVPFHALTKLNCEIADQLPAPAQSAWHANLEILAAIKRSRGDPSYNLAQLQGTSDRRRTQAQCRASSSLSR